MREVADDLVHRGLSAEAWTLDVADAAAIVAVVAAVAERFGGLDIVVNNAGVGGFAAIDAANYEAVWDRSLAILLTAHQRIIRAALPYLRKSAAPRIVNIASTEALGATARDSTYAAAKAGVTGLTRALAVELGREGITVNCICPGPILTGMTEAIPEADKRDLRQAPHGAAAAMAARRRWRTSRSASACRPPPTSPASTIPVDGGLMARNA